jgi:hypothetical protein
MKFEMPPKQELWQHEYKPILNFIDEHFFMHRTRPTRLQRMPPSKFDTAPRPEYNQLYANGEKRWTQVRRQLAKAKLQPPGKLEKFDFSDFF